MDIEVTIGICVKNEEITIEKAIRSVIEQNYPYEQMEIIIVDDGCTDDTLPIIETLLREVNITNNIIQSGEKGLGTARQLVVDNAKGDYILWLDGDMAISNNYIKLNINFLKSHPNIGKVRGTWTEDKGKNLVSSLNNLSYIVIPSNNTRQHEFTGVGASIFRTEAIKNVGGFDTHIRGAGEDIDLAAKIFTDGWSFAETSSEYYHEEILKMRDVWRKFWWYGYGMHYVTHKHKNVIVLWSYFPIITFFISLYRSFYLYKMTHNKITFLLPFYNFLKKNAWFLGFIRSHMDGYGHI